mgnify:CR=1 FL=1
MKKIKILWFLVLLLPLFTFAYDLTDCQPTKFVVTAYYSPKADQTFFYKSGFIPEVILNWEWYTWASGKPVFDWMLAWPNSYPFGAKIFFPDLWRWEISDRWWAIVNSWERWHSYDRIDIRMWTGEEWLIRALTFWKKTLDAYYCGTWISLSKSEMGIRRENIPIYKNFFDIAIWIQQLNEWRQDIRVYTLQKYLVKLGFLKSNMQNWNYDHNTKKAICNYQISRKIVSKTSSDCWTYGNRTSTTMKNDVKNRKLFPNDLYYTWKIEDIISYVRSYKTSINNANSNSSEKEIKKPTTQKYFKFYKAYKKGEQSSEIKILQKLLSNAGLFTWTINWIYDKITLNSVYEFQKKHSLITEKDPTNLRWYLGPKTREKLNEIIQK